MWYDQTIYELLAMSGDGFSKVEGEIGLELEMEGLRLPSGIPTHWVAHVDNSLRIVEGHQPQEYTLRKPVSRDDVKGKLSYLFKKLSDNGADIRLGQRTSVHVHLNVQDMTLKQVMTLLTLYYVYEDLLTEYAGGKLRQGNLFCLKAKDAEFVLKMIQHVMKDKSPKYLADQERLKYHACNISALYTFGSLEFRAHKGSADTEEISRWVNILLKLKDSSKEFSDPQQIIRDFSNKGVDGFTKKVFGEYAELFLNLYNSRIRLWDGLRLSMDVAYTLQSWESTVEEPQKIKPRRGKMSGLTITDFNTLYNTQTAVSTEQAALYPYPEPVQITSTVQTWAEVPQPAPPSTGITGEPSGGNYYYPNGYMGVPSSTDRIQAALYGRGILWLNGTRKWSLHLGEWEEVL